MFLLAKTGQQSDKSQTLLAAKEKTKSYDFGSSFNKAF
jgi:hypothetical protein